MVWLIGFCGELLFAACSLLLACCLKQGTCELKTIFLASLLPIIQCSCFWCKLTWVLVCFNNQEVSLFAFCSLLFAVWVVNKFVPLFLPVPVDLFALATSWAKQLVTSGKLTSWENTNWWLFSWLESSKSNDRWRETSTLNSLSYCSFCCFFDDLDPVLSFVKTRHSSDTIFSSPT